MVKKIKGIGMAMKTRAVLRTAYHRYGLCCIHVLRITCTFSTCLENPDDQVNVQ